MKPRGSSAERSASAANRGLPGLSELGGVHQGRGVVGGEAQVLHPQLLQATLEPVEQARGV